MLECKRKKKLRAMFFSTHKTVVTLCRKAVTFGKKHVTQLPVGHAGRNRSECFEVSIRAGTNEEGPSFPNENFQHNKIYDVLLFGGANIDDERSQMYQNSWRVSRLGSHESQVKEMLTH